MSLNEIFFWIWSNKIKIATDISQLFWITYVLILPKIYPTGIPQPWSNFCIIVSIVLTAYGFGNSAIVQGTKAAAVRSFNYAFKVKK